MSISPVGWSEERGPTLQGGAAALGFASLAERRPTQPAKASRPCGSEFIRD
ncbi:hypothetical protein FQZ97_705990 [compost metagenome]